MWVSRKTRLLVAKAKQNPACAQFTRASRSMPPERGRVGMEKPLQPTRPGEIQRQGHPAELGQVAGTFFK